MANCPVMPEPGHLLHDSRLHGGKLTESRDRPIDPKPNWLVGYPAFLTSLKTSPLFESVSANRAASLSRARS